MIRPWRMLGGYWRERMEEMRESETEKRERRKERETGSLHTSTLLQGMFALEHLRWAWAQGDNDLVCLASGEGVGVLGHPEGVVEGSSGNKNEVGAVGWLCLVMGGMVWVRWCPVARWLMGSGVQVDIWERGGYDGDTVMAEWGKGLGLGVGFIILANLPSFIFCFTIHPPLC